MFVNASNDSDFKVLPKHRNERKTNEIAHTSMTTDDKTELCSFESYSVVVLDVQVPFL